MLTKTLLVEALLYVGFLIGAVFFVQQSISEFMEGTTSYSESHEPISLQDLPSLTVCVDNWSYAFGLNFTQVYGNNLWIAANVSENGNYKTVTLIENRGVQTMFGLTIRLKQIVLGYWDLCFLITSDWNGEGSMNMGRFKIAFHFKFQEIEVNEATFWITTEGNSYGIVWSRWFDGTTSPQTLPANGTWVYTIEEVREFQNLKSTCQNLKST